ncbi:MAG: hypothetical protein ACI4WS_07800 [Oscillospiraceae bacterium]
MVWSAGDSPLYKCVERFNSMPQERCCEASEKQEKPCTDTECVCDKGKSAPDSGCNDIRENSCEKSTRHSADTRSPAPPPRPRTTYPQGSFLQRLTGDRDFMLIAALIVLLLHEKADMKLIAALAFIILT